MDIALQGSLVRQRGDRAHNPLQTMNPQNKRGEPLSALGDSPLQVDGRSFPLAPVGLGLLMWYPPRGPLKFGAASDPGGDEPGDADFLPNGAPSTPKGTPTSKGPLDYALEPSNFVHQIQVPAFLSKTSRQCRELYQLAAHYMNYYDHPALTFHHFVIAALSQAYFELSDQFTETYNRRAVAQNATPPIIRAFIPEATFRTQKEVKDGIPLFDKTHLSSKQLVSIINRGHKRLMAMVERDVQNRSWSPEDVRQQGALVQKWFEEGIKRYGNNVSTLQLMELLDQQKLSGREILDGVGLNDLQHFVRGLRREAEMVVGNTKVLTEEFQQQLDAIVFRPNVMNETARQEMTRKLLSLQNQKNSDTEKARIIGWLTRALELPWSAPTPQPIDIQRAKQLLEDSHYGLDEVKTEVLSYLTAMKRNPSAKQKILLLVGPPGTGKTSIAASIAQALGRPYQRFALGGISDSAAIMGHSETYVGAIPGRIMAMMKNAGAVNPVIVLDEVEKLSGNSNPKTAEAKSALLALLDPEQNDTFTDLYFGFPYPMNQVFWVLTANYLDQIPEALLDRVEVIPIAPYNDLDKVEIARSYLVPKVYEDRVVPRHEIEISDGTMMALIQGWTQEPGVRKLEAQIRKVVDRINLERELAGEKPPYKPIQLKPQDLPHYLGEPIYPPPAKISGKHPGEVNGLVYNGYGGGTLQVQVNGVPNGQWAVGSVTGEVQEVLKQSVQVAINCLEAHSEKYHVKPEAPYKGYRINVHFPPTSVKKEGPSAGVTIFTGIVSHLTGIPADPNVAMTGEVDLYGNVLPIGGLPEKLNAAKKAKIKTIFVPEGNRKDYNKIPADVRSGVKVEFVAHIDEILPKALPGYTVGEDPPKGIPAESQGETLALYPPLQFAGSGRRMSRLA